MEAVFLKVLNMSMTASYVIAAVLLLRLFLRKMPKKISYLLWSVVAFRLCCPISWQSVFSLFSLAPRTATVQVTAGGAAQLDHIPNTVTAAVQPQAGAGAAVPVNPGEVVSGSLPAAASADPLQFWITVGTVVWCAGMAALLIYSVICYVKMCRQMRTAVLLRDNIYQSDCIRSPFLLGLIHPKIYIPFGLDGDTLNYVLEHERYHIRRRDYLVKPFAFLLLTVHWFNPLCWLSFHLMGRDMEMSCDEKVIAGGANRVKAYSTTLLSFAVSPHFPAPSPLAFGETSVKSRIKNVLNWKKPKTWVTLLAVLLCVLAVLACAANPEQQADSEPDPVPVSDGVKTGQYASMEDFANEVLQSTIGRELTYSSYSLAESGAENTTAAARVLDAKVAQLEKTGELAGLASEGTLESWEFQCFVKTDADPDDVALVDGMFEDGWYDPEGAGGHVLVALRYEDGSYDILYDRSVSDAIIGMEFYSYHHSYEEAIYDWYVKEYGLDLPLYVIDLLPHDELGNHPAHRYDGDGWYLYIPVSGWSKANVWDQWNSLYGTGAHLSVQFCTDRMEDIKAHYGEVGAWPYETDMDSPFDYYYLLNPLGGDAQTELFFVPDTEQSSYMITCVWVKSKLREEELPVLHAMAASFTIDKRISWSPVTEEPPAMQAVLAELTAEDIASLTWDKGTETRGIAVSGEIIDMLHTAAETLYPFDQPDTFPFSGAGGVILGLSGAGDRHISFYAGDTLGSVLLRYVGDGINESAVVLDCFDLYLFLTASAENGSVELHDLDGNGLWEGLVWLNQNNKSLVIYEVYGFELHRIDVNEALDCTASDYTGLIANIQREYSNMILAWNDSGGDIYSYDNGVFSYVCPLSEALR
ncbi:MAG: M56 family metallopeptidase [Oscillospiraceae bacterium]